MPREIDFFPPQLDATTSSIQKLYVGGFYIDLGKRCNHNCPYCSIDKTAAFHPLPEMLELVAKAGQAGLRKGIFIGGEPSIYPHLEEIMEHGHRHGVTEYAMMTNASGLINAAKVKRLGELGLRLWQLSWDSYDEAVINRIHGSGDTLQRLYQALENIARDPENMVCVYQVVIRENFHSIPEMVRFTARLRERYPNTVRLLISAIVRPVTEAWRNREVLFALDEALPAMREAVAAARETGLPFFYNHLPPCILPEATEFTHSSFNMERRMDLDTGQVQPYLAQTDYLKKGEACLSCRAFESCTGYYLHYSEMFGEHLYRPSGHLLREDPLPEHLLEPYRQVRSHEPLTKEVVTAQVAAKLDLEERRRERAAERLSQWCAEQLGAGWQVSDCRYEPSQTRPRMALSLGKADGGAALRVHIEAQQGQAAYLRGARHTLSYQGKELGEEHKAALQLLHTALDALPEGELQRMLPPG